MTESEAKKILERLLSVNILVGNENEAVSVAIKALEKQIAKKVIVEQELFGFSKDGGKNIVFSFFCPNCNMQVRVRSKHCDNCGQKLDWSEV